MVAIPRSDYDSFCEDPDPRYPVVLIYGPNRGLVSERIETLLKNTLDEEVAPKGVEPPPPPPPKPVEPARRAEAKTAPRNTQKRDLQIAQRKISEQQFYPPEAIARNLEGEVRLIIKLAENGAVDDVGIAASSGHALLDNAAIRAAYAMGSLTGVTSRELILPVVFRLE